MGSAATVSISNVHLTNNAAVGGNGGSAGSGSITAGNGGDGSSGGGGGTGGATVGASGTAGTANGGGGAGANGIPGDGDALPTPIAPIQGGNGAAGGYGAGGGGGSGGGTDPGPPAVVPGVPGTGGTGGGWGTAPGNFGGGNGADGTVNTADGGGGGAGLGGAIFVQGGGKLSIGGTLTVNGNTVTGGSGAGGGGNGDAFGQGMFLMPDVSVLFAPGAGQTQTFSNDITDELGSSGGLAGGSGSIVKDGLGTLILLGTNSYTGGTTVDAGILQGNSTSLQGGIRVNADGTVVFNQNFNGTFDGQLTGDGVVIKQGNGILTYDQTQDNRGGTFVNAGTLRAGVIDALPGGQDIFVASGATLDLNSFNNSIGGLNGSGTVTLGSAQLTLVPEVDPGSFSGNITGTGSILKNGAARQVLTGINTYTGGTVIDGGTLEGNTLSLQGNIQVNAQLTFNQNFNGTFTGAISGSGDVNKQGTGELIFNTPHTYSGTTNINDGVLTVNSTLASDVLINPFGRLGGTGTVGSVQQDGTISPGNSAIGTLNINGNLTTSSTSNYQVQINGAGQNDLIAVNGAAQLNGGTVQVLPSGGGIRRNQAYTILTANGGVNGQYDGITGSGIGYILTNLIYNPNDVQVLLTSNFKVLGGTFNEIAVENYLDGIVTAPGADLDNALLAIDTLSPSQARAAMDQIGGAQHSTMLTAGLMKNLYLVQQLSDQLRAPAFVVGSPGSTVRGASPDGEYSTWGGDGAFRGWFKGYGLNGQLSGDGNGPGMDYTFGGGLAGLEINPDNNSRLGAYVGYTNNNITFQDANPGDAKGNGALLGGYAMETFGQFHVMATGNYGITDYNTRRQISFANINRVAEGSPQTNDANVYAEIGYLLPIYKMTFQPILGLQYAYVNQDGFTETGAGGLNLTEQGASAQSLWGMAGGRFSLPYQDGNWAWRPYIHGKYVRDYFSEDRLITGALSGVGGAFTVKGVTAGQDFMVGGAGITVQHGNVRFTADYTALTNDVQTSQTGSAALEFRW